jgi:hypothetical protein
MALALGADGGHALVELVQLGQLVQLIAEEVFAGWLTVGQGFVHAVDRC